jgi:hypothetical protein
MIISPGRFETPWLTSTWHPSTTRIAVEAKRRIGPISCSLSCSLSCGVDSATPASRTETHKSYPLWWLGFGIRPSRSCWYEFRDRAGVYVDTLNAQLLHQAVEKELTTAERGALDGSAVAANASRRRLINQARLEQRLGQLEAVRGCFKIIEPMFSIA